MKELTEEQEAAVNSTASLILVDACPGAGKTLTLVARIRRLIAGGVHPNRMVAISYTNSAAGELARRIAPVNLGCCSTLHGFMVRILKRYGPQFGYAANFGILTETQAIEMMEETAKEMRYAGTIRGLCEAIEAFAAGVPKRTLSKTELVAAGFYINLYKNNLVTFDMILRRGAEVVQKIAERPGEMDWPYEYLFWDEGQDCSPLDLRILDALPCDIKYVCLDFRQSIMGFRGSDITCCKNYFLHGELEAT